jgi:hypothetical protein
LLCSLGWPSRAYWEDSGDRRKGYFYHKVTLGVVAVRTTFEPNNSDDIYQ